MNALLKKNYLVSIISNTNYCEKFIQPNLLCFANLDQHTLSVPSDPAFDCFLHN